MATTNCVLAVLGGAAIGGTVGGCAMGLSVAYEACLGEHVVHLVGATPLSMAGGAIAGGVIGWKLNEIENKPYP